MPTLLISLLLTLTFNGSVSKGAVGSCLKIIATNYFDGSQMRRSQKVEIIVIDGRIQTVSPISQNRLAHKQPLTPSCKNLDLTKDYLMPALIDAHTHMFSFDKSSAKGWADALQKSAEREVGVRILQGRKNLYSMLQWGFATVRDLGNSGDFLDFKLKDILAKKSTEYPGLEFSGPGLAVSPTQIDISRAKFEYKLIEKPSEIEGILDVYRQKSGLSWIKVYLDNSPGVNQMPKPLLDKIIEIAKKKKLKIAVHAETKESVDLALESKVDSIEHFYSLPSKGDGFKEIFQYIVLTETPAVACLGFQKNTAQSESAADSFCKKQTEFKLKRKMFLQSKKAKIVFGSDAVLDFTHNYNSRGEAALESLISWPEMGFSPEESLQAATKTAGEMLQLKVGQIKVGYRADFLVLEKDPALDLNNLRGTKYVIRSGLEVCSPERRCHGN